MPASLSSAVYSLKTIAFCTMSGVKMMNCIIEDHLVFVMGIYEGRTESHEQLFLHVNWKQQTKKIAVVDRTSCCVILECLVTSIACIT